MPEYIVTLRFVAQDDEEAQAVEDDLVQMLDPWTDEPKPWVECVFRDVRRWPSTTEEVED